MDALRPLSPAGAARAAVAALALAGAGNAGAATPPAGPALPRHAPDRPGSPGIPELLRSAHLWQVLGQAAIERPVLEKVLAVDRTDPVALLRMAELDLERGDLAAAGARLEVLRQAHPGSAQARDLARLLELHSRQGERLARLRMLERGGRMVEALAIARALFPDGMPPGALADEFATLLGRDPVAWERLAGLLRARLAREDNPVDREALAGLLSLREESRAEAMAMFAALASGVPGDGGPVAGEWRRAIGRMPEGDAAQEQRRKYLARFGKDPVIVADLIAGERRAAARAAALVAQSPSQAQAPVAPVPEAAPAANPAGAPPSPEAQAAPALAGAAVAPVPAEAPADAPTPREKARALRGAGDAAGARAMLEQALARSPADPWLRHDLAKDRLAAGDVAGALSLAREGLALAPADADMRFAAGLVFAAADRNAEALAAIEPVPEAGRSEGLRALAARLDARIEELAARQRPRVEAGTLFTHRSATEGISSLRARESPLVLHWPLAAGGVAFAQVDEVRIDGGRPGAADASQLGSLAVQGSAAALDPVSHGTSVAAGWTGEAHQGFLGLAGASGFAVRNWVGGWRAGTQVGGFDLAAGLARSVLSGSRLSAAGEVDPGTGIAWGGVTDNALRLRAARDFGPDWSGSSALSLSAQRGTHVAGNTGLQSRTTLERVLVRAPGLSLRAGAVASFWHYARDENFTTLGHGGYYSPQRYASLGLTLALDVDRPDWRATLRATPSRSWTREDGAAWFPLDPVLQAAAGNRRYAASTGGGLAGSLRAEVQARIARGWSAGAAIDIDRSTDYAPTTALVFVRWAFAGPTSPALPASPVPVSRLP